MEKKILLHELDPIFHKTILSSACIIATLRIFFLIFFFLDLGFLNEAISSSL